MNSEDTLAEKIGSIPRSG